MPIFIRLKQIVQYVRGVVNGVAPAGRRRTRTPRGSRAKTRARQQVPRCRANPGLFLGREPVLASARTNAARIARTAHAARAPSRRSRVRRERREREKRACRASSSTGDRAAARSPRATRITRGYRGHAHGAYLQRRLFARWEASLLLLISSRVDPGRSRNCSPSLVTSARVGGPRVSPEPANMAPARTHAADLSLSVALPRCGPPSRTCRTARRPHVDDVQRAQAREDARQLKSNN